MTKEEKAEEWVKTKGTDAMTCLKENIGWDDVCKQAFKDGAEFGYNKANEWHSPEEHIDYDRIVLGFIKHCNKMRYSLVQWNGEWWYQYGSFNAEVRLIAWCFIPEPPKEIE